MAYGDPFDLGLGGLASQFMQPAIQPDAYGVPGLGAGSVEEEDYLAQLEQLYQDRLDTPAYVPETVEPPDMTGTGKAGLGRAMMLAGAGILQGQSYMSALSGGLMGFSRGLTEGADRERQFRQQEYQNKVDEVARRTRDQLAVEKGETRKLESIKGLAGIQEAKTDKERKAKALEDFDTMVQDIAEVDPESAALIAGVYRMGEKGPDKAADLVNDWWKENMTEDDAKDPSYQRFNVGDKYQGIFNPKTGQTVYVEHPGGVIGEDMTPEDAREWFEDLKEESAAIAVQRDEDNPSKLDSAGLALEAKRIMLKKIMDQPELYSGLEPYLSATEKAMLENMRREAQGIAQPQPREDEQTFGDMDALLAGG